MSPLPQRCTSLAHEEATLPLSLLSWPWLLPLRSPSPSLLPLPTPAPLPLPSPIAVAVTIGHCHCGHCQQLPPLSHLRRCQPLPSPLPSPLAIAISVTINHRSFHLHWPSLLPPLSAISESCCLGAARIVFKQFKQRILGLFCFVWILGGTLIKAG